MKVEQSPETHDRIKIFVVEPKEDYKVYAGMLCGTNTDGLIGDAKGKLLNKTNKQ